MNESIVEFFRRGQHGDLLVFKQYGGWESIFTMAPHNPDNAARIAEQFSKMDADHLVHAEKVVLQARDGTLEEVVVITDLPIGQQTVVVIGTGEKRKLRQHLHTETLIAITSAIYALGATVEK